MSYVSVIQLDGKLSRDALLAWFQSFAGVLIHPMLSELVIASKGVYADVNSCLEALNSDKDRASDWRDALGDGKALAFRHQSGTGESVERAKEPTFAGTKFGESRLLGRENLRGNEPDFRDRYDRPIYLLVLEYQLEAREKAKKPSPLADDPLTGDKIKKAKTFEITGRGRVGCGGEWEALTFVWADQITEEDRALLADLLNRHGETGLALSDARDELHRLAERFKSQFDPVIREAEADSLVSPDDLKVAQSEAEKAAVEHEKATAKMIEESTRVRDYLYDLKVKKAEALTHWSVMWLADNFMTRQIRHIAPRGE